MTLESSFSRDKRSQPWRFDKRVTLYLWSDVPTGLDALTHQNSSMMLLWADKQPIMGRAYQDGVAIENKVTDRFVFRRPPNGLLITQHHVIEHTGQRYRVKRVVDLDSEQKILVETECLGSTT